MCAKATLIPLNDKIILKNDGWVKLIKFVLWKFDIHGYVVMYF